MDFFEAIREESNITTTLNGAKTYSSSADACLDLFSIAGSIRNYETNAQIKLFEKAYMEEPELAMKLLFYIRDIRFGLGERKLFRTLLRNAAIRWQESVRKNIAYITEYGRYDDLLCLLGTPVEDVVVELVQKQWDMDLDAVERREQKGELSAHVSLLAKWLPSATASSYRTKNQAKKIAAHFGLTVPEYRKKLSKLRSHIGLTERYLTEKSYDKLQYHAVPGGAVLKYRGAFLKRDEARFRDFLTRVGNGEEKIHSAGIFPYELARPFLDYRNMEVTYGSEVLDLLWKSLSCEVASENSVCVVDTSGSMFSAPKHAVLPAAIAFSLGLLYAQNCKGLFHNRMITFETEPHVIDIHGDTLEDMLTYIGMAPWGGSTNLVGVFDLILQTAIKYHAKQEEMPEVIYIFSDMEFNQAVDSNELTNYEMIRKMFEEEGYKLPAIVFHNVNSWSLQLPVGRNTRGTAMASGASAAALKERVTKVTTPYSFMLQVLNGERYEVIHA